MGLTSYTGLLATDQKTLATKPKGECLLVLTQTLSWPSLCVCPSGRIVSTPGGTCPEDGAQHPPRGPMASTLEVVQLKCSVAPAPFVLRPFAALYNPFQHSCSILCNHPAPAQAARQLVKKARPWNTESRMNLLSEHPTGQGQGDSSKPAHDIVTEDMLRRYTETDSQPHTPAPTLASGKSLGSRRCLTPDQQSLHRTLIVVDLRRSHSQETLYYHGYTTSNLTSAPATSGIQSLPITDSTHARLLKGPSERQQLPPLASPLVLSKRATREPAGKSVKKNQLKALNISKPAPKKTKSEPSKSISAEDEVASPCGGYGDDVGVVRRRGRRRRKGRQGSDRQPSAGLVATVAQDPETQIAGIGSDSHNPSSRGSLAPAGDAVTPAPPPESTQSRKKIDSFLDEEILKYLHREVDRAALETEFDNKRRCVLAEALRTRPARACCGELHSLLRELPPPGAGLAGWLHVARVFSRSSAQFSLPIDTRTLTELTPMQYIARYVNLKKSKQLLYLTVLQKYRPDSYHMPVHLIPEALALMMGGALAEEQTQQFAALMRWDEYSEPVRLPDDIKLTFNWSDNDAFRLDGGDSPKERSLKYRTWCGLCAACERLYARYKPRDRDPPDGMEASDFLMLDSKLAFLQVDSGLLEILTAIRTR